MNENLAASPPSPVALASEPAHVPLERDLVAAALAAIAADSERDADYYLRDTVVPHGGE